MGGPINSEPKEAVSVAAGESVRAKKASAPVAVKRFVRLEEKDG